MITIEQVIEQCAQLAEVWDSDAPIAKYIRALAAQYEGCIVAGAAAEREACAKVCDAEADQHEHLDRNGRSRHLDDATVARTCAAAIRARGEK